MKKIFVLILTVLLVVACFSGCGKERYMYSQSEGFYHNYGDISELDVGIYSVKQFKIVNGEETFFRAKWLIVEEDGDLILQDPITNSWNYIK